VYNLIILLPDKKCPLLNECVTFQRANILYSFIPTAICQYCILQVATSQVIKKIFLLEEKVNLMVCREHISNMQTQKIQISYYYKTLSPVMGNTPWDKANDITNCKYLTSRYAD